MAELKRHRDVLERVLESLPRPAHNTELLQMPNGRR